MNTSNSSTDCVVSTTTTTTTKENSIGKRDDRFDHHLFCFARPGCLLLLRFPLMDSNATSDNGNGGLGGFEVGLIVIAVLAFVVVCACYCLRKQAGALCNRRPYQSVTVTTA